jgi:hypothetical protein
MEIYYTLYGVFLACILFEFQPSVKIKKMIMFLWCIVFIIFGGLRWGVGGDWEQYLHHFRNSDWNNIFDYTRYGDSKLEPGFVFFNVIIRTLFGYFWIYNIIILCIINYAYYKFCILVSPKHPLIPFILLFMGVLFPVRAGLSMGFCYLAYQYIIKRNFKKFIFWILIATALHNQCIVLVPLYFLCYVNLRSYQLLILYVAFALLGMVIQKYFAVFILLFSGSIAEKAAHYTDFETTGFKGASYIGWVLNFFFLILYLYVGNKMKIRKTLAYNTLLNGFMIYMVIFFTFSEGMGDLSRLAGLYFPCQLALFANAFSYFYDVKKGFFRIVTILFIVSYYTYKYSGAFKSYYFEESCVPYKTIFDDRDAFR